jgi:multidrug efflux pump subunit AcrA (membrane-fusion protein)
VTRYLVVVLSLVSAGCGSKAPPAQSTVKTDPTVRLVHTTVRDLTRTIGQPSFIDSYEQTAIYAKLPGYVLEWHVDIGDPIKKDQVLATIYIPELKEEVQVKTARVEMDTALVQQAHKLVDVAAGNLRAAEAQVVEAKANVNKFEALVVRWQSEVEREKGLVAEDVLDQQILDESTRQLQASIASRDASIAAVDTAEAERIARAADLEKAKVDVQVADASLDVAEADEKRVEALYSYTKLLAPYDGIVVLRNANTGDFVLPAMGDPSAAPRSADQSTSKAAPIYVVARTDVVRMYVDVPEQDANHIVSEVARKAGDPRDVTKATVLVSAFRDSEIPGQVTRSSWALNFTSRTLRAEIDLPNPDAKLLPGMYAYGQVVFERKGATVLPKAAVTMIGNQATCYLYQNGKAAATLIETGVRVDEWIEVLRKQTNGQWQPFDGKEQVILGDMSELVDGQKVIVEN